MTRQTQEKLIFNGETLGIGTEPLASYLSKLEIKPKFIFMGSSCWRGYIGTWKLIEDKLYLVELIGYAHNDKKEYWDVDMGFLFPHQKKVFAEWFTGEIIIPQGEGYSYDIFHFAPHYESELILVFEKGYIIGQRTVYNHEMIVSINKFHETKNIKARKEELKLERKKSRELFFKKIFRLLLGKR